MPRIRTTFLSPAVVFTIALAFRLPLAGAQTLTVLYRFSGAADGEFPEGSLIHDSAGNLYGTASGGCCDATTYGSIFKIDPSGNETTLHSFTHGSDGANPQAALIRDSAGNLYGTASAGGTYGGGTVYKLDPSNNFTTLWAFGAYRGDGEIPFGPLIRDTQGNLYGTTVLGPGAQCGTVFKVNASGIETLLHVFQGDDGCNPYAGLVSDSKGNFYGTTFQGGAHGGVVFRLTPSGVESVLYNLFRSESTATLLLRSGQLYGTGATGGTYYKGFAFAVSASTGIGGKLYSFVGQPDGDEPTSGLIADPAGNLYGTTFVGGSFNKGAIFKLDPFGHETILYSFTGGSDGANPAASLMFDSAGNLYGTAFYGGDVSCFAPYGCGVVFKLTP